MDDGTWIKGNLKAVEKPQLNNLDIFVKNVYVDSKEFDFKVEGWLNYNKLQLTSSRDAIIRDPTTGAPSDYNAVPIQK